MATKQKRGLGRGLDALLRPERAEEDSAELQYISIDRIHPNRYQPRKAFNEESLNNLVDSIKANGILEPLLLRPVVDGFELVAGERRLRAARAAGLSEVPCIVRFFDDRQTAEIALIENLQREDLNPIEEASSFSRLLQEFNLTQDELAQRVGRSRSHLSNTLRLLQLPAAIQDMLLNGLLEMGHARSLLTLPLEQQIALANEVITRGLTVRQCEARVRLLSLTKAPRQTADNKTSKKRRFWEGRMRQLLENEVRIFPQGSGGRIEIPYKDSDDLERVMTILLREE